MAQRLMVARAIMHRPAILFLDEPTAGLDPQARHATWNLIEGLRAAGTGVILTTHYMEEAERLCDRVAVVDHGRIIALGSPADLIAGLHAPHIIEFATDPAVDDGLLARIPGIGDRRQRDGRWLLAAGSLAEAVPALLDELDRGGAKLVSLSTHRATLEDVFLSLTGRELRDE
jgi:ABC-2 type transport system ATP-binding protein